MNDKVKTGTSIFTDSSVKEVIEEAKNEIKELYLSDKTPWVIGYSGGKDSTAVLQLVWMAVSDLPEKKRKKPIYVLTSDTLVENPIVAQWVNSSLKRVELAAKDQKMPMSPTLVSPAVSESYWVNLIGKGYPAPRHKFRWCTERLKIQPSNRFIQNIANNHGEVILLLGTRRAESDARKARMKKRKRFGTSNLTRHDQLVNTFIYSPVEFWSNDDIWTFLMQFKNPWEHRNKDLLTMYRGATDDNECPVVVDTSTPSCGSSRFGCWTCTLVGQDKSMTAMVSNDSEKEWMRPLLNFRNLLDFRGNEAKERDRSRRDFKRLGGYLSHYMDRDGEFQLTPGPYKQDARGDLLRRLLSAQKEIQDNPKLPEELSGIEIIKIEELEEIRRIWLTEKHEIEDLLPQIYFEVFEKEFPGADTQSSALFDQETSEILQKSCEDDRLLYEVTRNLISLEMKYKNQQSRRGIYKEIDKTIAQGFFDNAEDAKSWKKRQLTVKESKAGELLKIMEESDS